MPSKERNKRKRWLADRNRKAAKARWERASAAEKRANALRGWETRRARKALQANA